MNQESVYVSAAELAAVESVVSQRLRHSLLWMVWGLATTFLIGFLMVINPTWLHFTANHFNVLMLVEVGVVFYFSFRAYKANLSSLKAMFFLYSALNGLTLTLVALSYGFEAILSASIGTVAFFGAAAFVGNVTKRDLTKLSNIALAALFAMIICSIAMMFLGFNETINMVLGYVGIVVFSIFTAVDINRIKRNVTAVALTEDESILERVSLVGALSLYLDFINMFLSILRIFGRK